MLLSVFAYFLADNILLWNWIYYFSPQISISCGQLYETANHIL